MADQHCIGWPAEPDNRNGYPGTAAAAPIKPGRRTTSPSAGGASSPADSVTQANNHGEPDRDGALIRAWRRIPWDHRFAIPEMAPLMVSNSRYGSNISRRRGDVPLQFHECVVAPRGGCRLGRRLFEHKQARSHLRHDTMLSDQVDQTLVKRICRTLETRAVSPLETVLVHNLKIRRDSPDVAPCASRFRFRNETFLFRIDRWTAMRAQVLADPGFQSRRRWRARWSGVQECGTRCTK